VAKSKTRRQAGAANNQAKTSETTSPVDPGISPEALARLDGGRIAYLNGLLAFRENRSSLVDGLRQISSRIDGLGYLTEDKYPDGGAGFVKDICPFTTMGIFNRGINDANRKMIAVELAKLLEVSEPVPQSFEGIPILNNLKSWYFPREVDRPPDHIDALWEVFSLALRFADSQDQGDDARADFAKAFDNANGRSQARRERLSALPAETFHAEQVVGEHRLTLEQVQPVAIRLAPLSD
jgi:hypothetical protein